MPASTFQPVVSPQDLRMNQDAMTVLLACLGYASKTAKAERLTHISSEEWQAVAELARQHGVALLAYHRLKRLGIALPGELADKLKQDLLGNAARNMRLYKELGKLLRRLWEQDIAVIALKGASNRLPAPWRSLCDDTTLVVRDPQGNYWAHPWPTWSRFLDEGPGGAWDVQNAVPVKGIFFLVQAVEDQVERMGPGHAVSLLVECAKQASQLMARGLNKEETRLLHLERFNNLCALARVIPAHVLRISLTGAFWQEIEQALEGGRSLCKSNLIR